MAQEDEEGEEGIFRLQICCIFSQIIPQNNRTKK